MKKILLITIFLILGNVKIVAQKHELGSVTIEELKEKVHPKDSSAVAAVLFNKCKVSFEYNRTFTMVTEVQVKIKIYKKEGYQWGNEEIPFYVGSSKESVVFSNAVTYNLINNEIQLTKAKAENEFIEEKNKSFKIKKITMPNIKEGSIIEYKYIIRTPYISNFRDWQFQKKIPVNYSELITDIPEYFFYNIHRKGSLPFIETKDKFSKFISFNKKPNNWEYQKKSMIDPITHDVDQISYLDNRTIYTLENIPALKEELFVNNIDNYASNIEHELAGVRYPNSSYETFSITWDEIVKDINESEYFGDQLNKTNYFEKDLTMLLTGLLTSEEKITAIFKYVQSRMNWNKYYSYTCDDGVKKAYEDKTGNSAEINLMLVSMLRYANLDANPVLVSTRSNGISIFPSRTAYNIVIASVLIDGNLVFMDATNKNSSIGILPIRDLNWFGRLIKKDGTSDLVDLMPKISSYDVVNMLVRLDEKGQAEGQVREQYLDYKALKFRENFSTQTIDTRIQKIEKEYKDIEIEDYNLVNDKNFDDSVVEKYSVKNTNAYELIGNKIYFSPMLQFAMSENPFKQETREYPIDFSFPVKDMHMINLTIPDGYQVESMPKNIAIAMDNKYGSFRYTITNTSETQIQLSVVLEINSSIIPSEHYDTLKQFFKVIIEKENEKIILKKN